MLKANNLSKNYGTFKALDKLNLSVSAGEIFCLLGANGAGKTTTINIFLNFIQPTSGAAFINDISSNSDETKKYLAYIPENLNLYGNLTGVENLQFFSDLSGNKLEEVFASNLLNSAGLQSKAINKRVSGYSKGMRQKVGIAIAKAKNADNLLLDEPTSGLDPKASNDFTQLLLKLKDEGTAILMTTHDLFRAKETATHFGIMKEGSLVHTMKSNEVTLKQLENLYVETMRVYD
tara:strand:+ start:56 stop:757 length:702 start_codon:yes stop_codon:yes gene_type:complete